LGESRYSERTAALAECINVLMLKAEGSVTPTRALLEATSEITARYILSKTQDGVMESARSASPPPSAFEQGIT